MTPAGRFRKKPVEITAIQYDGKNGADVCAFMGATVKWAPGEGLEITTLEGTMTASIGDWVIKGVRNEFYPCKPEIFEATYERVV